MADDKTGGDGARSRRSTKKIVVLFVVVLTIGLGAGVGMNFVLSKPKAKKSEKEAAQNNSNGSKKSASTQPNGSSSSAKSTHKLEAFSSTNAMSHVSALSQQIGPRKAGSMQESAAADYIVARLGEYGYTVEEQPFTMADGFGSRNVVATKDGTREGYTVVIAAHYDSPVDSPGAVDNASGVGVALELARIFAASNLETGLQFAFFGANRPGTVGQDQRLEGARHFADLLGSLQKKEIIGMIALDSVGQGDVLTLRTEETGLQRLRDKLRTFAGEKKISVASLKSTDDSDNIPFEDAKLPAVWVEWCDAEGALNTDNSLASVDSNKMEAVGNLVESFVTSLSPQDLEELKY